MRRRLLGNKRGEQNIAFGSTVFYDTSGQFSPANNKVFTVRRSTDNVVDTFSAEDITSGAYATWLNGATGFLTNWKDEKAGYPDAVNTNGVILLTNGKINFPANTKLSSSFTQELPDHFISAFVMSDHNNDNTQKYDFGAYGINTGFSMRLYYKIGGGFQQGELFFTVKTSNFTQQNLRVSSGYNPNIKNVFVLESLNGVIKMIINGVTKTTFSAGNINDCPVEFGIQRINIASPDQVKINPQNQNHASIYLNPTKTPEEISQELINTYQ